jgi:hypothetical protein
MKYIIIPMLFLVGCASSEKEPEVPEWWDKRFDLLYREVDNTLAYKSVTKEDYEIKEYN